MFARPAPARHVAAALAAAIFLPVVISISTSSRASSRNASAAYSTSRDEYASKISSTYNFRFGKDQPFQPSNAQIDGDEFIEPGAFPPAAYCGHCHTGAYHQWSQSLHRNAFREPFYVKNVTLLNDTKGIEYSRHCEGCHSPISLFSGALTQNSHVNRAVSDDEGVTCSVCHSIEKLQTMKGNGGYVMGVPTAMVDEHGAPIPGEVPFKEILAHPDRHSKAVMKDFYRSPEFCGACHKSTVPTNLTDYKWLRGFGTYDEWQASAYSNRSPVPFYQTAYTTCQNCHMNREAVDFGEYGAKNGSIASHRWLGGNTAVPFYYGFSEQLKKTTEFLKNETLNVDIFALKHCQPSFTEQTSVCDGDLIAPLGTAPSHLYSGETVQAWVVIQNKGLGHSLIPEQRDFYEAWVEFTVTDSTGKEIFHSGFLNPDGSLDELAHSFTSRLVGKDGQLLSLHQIWDRRAVAFDNTILPGRSTLVRYQFTVPDSKNSSSLGPIRLTARVNYRHFTEAYLDYVLTSQRPAYPIVEMASSSRKIEVGARQAEAQSLNPATKLASGPEAPEWLRWNNFGIALVDQSQFSGAVYAFEHVIKLRPDYPDAWTNLAIANLRWEHFTEAESAVERALTLLGCHPNSATGEVVSVVCAKSGFPVDRALYFRSLIERNQDNGLDSAIADLKLVTRDFPQSREAGRELAVSYFLAHEDDLSRRTFEALQLNDPDDLLAHYYLAVLYRRVGLDRQAADQTSRYEQERDDPGSGERGLMYLRAQPGIRGESLSEHVHSKGKLGQQSNLDSSPSLRTKNQ